MSPVTRVVLPDKKLISPNDTIQISIERGQKKSVLSTEVPVKASAAPSGANYADFDGETLSVDATLYRNSSGWCKFR